MADQGKHNPEVNNLLQTAKDLGEEKEAVYMRINANREILRNYKVLGSLSAEQSKAIDEFYPVPNRTKGNKRS
jgi:hypothetical protein